MKRLTLEDLLSYEDYERARDSFRQRIIARKRRRRLPVGDKVTLVFENRETIQFQVQEMLRAEHIIEPQRIQAELDVYNALVPEDGQLSATLLIEITSENRLKEDLEAFQGIDRGQVVALKAGRHVVYGEFETGHSKEDKISAVHFVLFRPGPEWFHDLHRQDSPVSVVIDHPAYRQEAHVPAEMREEWLADLQSDITPPQASS